MHLQVYQDIADLPSSYFDLFERAGRQNFYFSLPWFRNLTRTTMDEGDELRIYGVETDAPEPKALAILIARHPARTGKILGLRALAGFTNFYSMEFAPVIDPVAENVEEVTRVLIQGLAAEKPRWEMVKLQAMDPATPIFSVLENQFREAGLLVQNRFDFVNWYERTAGVSYEQYVKSLSGKMRNLLKRRTRKLERSNEVRYLLITDRTGLDDALADYQTIYEKSWKEAEPYPVFVGGFVEACVEAGVLRMGMLYVDEQPAAAQIWTVCNGSATIYKLAYDERFRDLSVGSILTARIMEHVLDKDHPHTVDYGHGDDPYKKDWLRERRERRTLIAYNPRTIRGAAAALYQIGGRAIKRFLVPA